MGIKHKCAKRMSLVEENCKQREECRRFFGDNPNSKHHINMELKKHFDLEVEHFASTREEHLFQTFYPLFPCTLSLVWKIIKLIEISPLLVFVDARDQQKQGL